MLSSLWLRTFQWAVGFEVRWVRGLGGAYYSIHKNSHEVQVETPYELDKVWGQALKGLLDLAFEIRDEVRINVS